MDKGQVIKALSGFYYIHSEEGHIYQTRARGIFRKDNITPLVGDHVYFTYGTDKEGTLEDILPRKNELKRPPVSNVDVGVVVMSISDPDFSVSLLDRNLVTLEYNDIEPVIYVTKTDIASEETYLDIKLICEAYEKIGYTVILPEQGVVLTSEEIHDLLRPKLEKKTSVFMGQSGAGKSTLLNKMDRTLELKTGETSKSLGRGRHTTRHVELVPMLGGLIADTPGFSAIQFEVIDEQELPTCFPEIWEHGKDCRFSGCIHQNEPNCAVKAAVDSGEIEAFRYKNYLSLLEEVQNRKPKYGKKGDRR
ncbi:ribosome small subunit-dependent GTPase A [Alkalibacterium sp. MB6]|uniref:ribosome small subunit-dependent GTPase A n=1 Tax=Alkalibacterium sp. MB6 TaxID=2081965 RepID=UPI001379D49C|nr:ribosome small subunit-dependent GTPase A [Alkalibacterium sp. MB6]